MLEQFYSLPSWVVIFGFTAFAVLFSALVIFCLQSIFKFNYSQELATTIKGLISFRLQGTVSLILGFAIVTSITFFHTSIENLSEEAFRLETISEMSDYLAEPSKKEVRRALSEYLQSVIKNEWPAMRSRDAYEGDPTTKRYLRALSQSIHAAKIQIENKNVNVDAIYSAYEQASLLRQKRLVNAHSEVPRIFWVFTFVLLVIISVLAAGLEFDGTHHNALYISIGTGVIGLLAGFLLVMSQPFSGDFSVTPEPLLRVLSTLEK
mgnify:CR=1 FL=1